jgi:hypothetical protein
MEFGMSELNKKNINVMRALEKTFNSKLVTNLSNDDYKEYILMCATLTIGTLIKNEGHEFVKGFCEAALNNRNEFPITQQIKNH